MRDLFVTPETFHQAVGPFLARGQVLNQVLLGVFEQYRAEPGRYQGEPRLLALQDPVTGEIGLTMQTLPYKAMVSACSEAMGTALGRAFAQRHPDARTVFGKVESARAFSQGAGSAEPQVITRDAVFELRIVLPSAPVPGQARLATPMDAAMLQGWVEAFNTEALPAGWPKDPNAGTRMAASGRTWIWIAYVFTPRQHRGHGYASGVVAHASSLALASGAQGCTLFTDLLNPVSNRVYERIGYRRVGEFTTLQW